MSESIIAKIRKMLELANNSAASEGERENALRMAHNLLIKHNLEMKDVHASSVKEKRTVDEAATFKMKWCRIVANSMAKLFMCEMFLNGDINGTKGKYAFVGLESNATTAALMTEYVISSILKEARKLYKQNLCPQSRAFGYGAAEKIRDRVNKMVHEAKSDNSTIGTGLVIRDVYKTEHELNLEFISKNFNLVPIKSSRTKIDDWNAYSQGSKHGDKIDLNLQVENVNSNSLQLGVK